MKTALFIALAACSLCTTSCTKDDSYTPTTTTQARESTEEPTSRNTMAKPPKGKGIKPEWE